MAEENMEFVSRPIYRKMAELLLKYRLPILILLLVITAFFIPQLFKLRIGNSVEGMLPQGDPELAYYNEFKEQFGSENILVVAFEADDVFETEILQKIDILTKRFSKVENVEGVISLTNFKDVFVRDDFLEVKEVMTKLPQNKEEIEALRKRIFSNPTVIGNIVSADSKIAAIVIQSKDLTVSKDPKVKADNLADKRLVAAIKKILEEEKISNPHIAGISYLRGETSNYMAKDLRNFIPPTIGFMVILLALIFRNIPGVLLPISAVVMALIWILALIPLTGRTLTIVSTMLPPLILVSTIGVSIHLISEYYEEARTIKDKREALIKNWSYIIVPCFLTSITTVFGYFSNYTAPVQPVKEFGFASGIGVIFGFLISVTLVPIILSYCKHPSYSHETGKHSEEGFRLYKLLINFAIWLNLNHRKKLFWGTIIGIFLSAMGVSTLEIDTNILSYFNNNDPIKQSFDFIEGKLAGTNSLNIDIKATEEGYLKEPEALRKIEKLQQFLLNDESKAIKQALSIVDIIKSFNKAMNDNKPEAYRIPDTRPEISQYLTVLESSGDSEGISKWIDPFGYKRTRVASRVDTIGSKDMVKLIERINKYLKENFNDEKITGHATGQAVLMANLVHLMLISQIQSLGLALFLISLCMMSLFWAFKLGMISMIPNIIPITITLGMMGLIGVTLNVATVMISCIALGIAVDGTIHYFSRFRREFQIDQDYDKAMARALHAVGPAMIFASVIVALGFSILFLSKFKLTFYFGVLMGFTMISALLADLVVGPVSLIYLRPKFKVQNLKIGDNSKN